MSEQSGIPKTLFERNLIVLAEHVSLPFAERLATLQSDLALVKDKGTGLLNIEVGGRRMYPSGAEPFAARQVAEFVDNPQSLSLSPVLPTDDRALISDRATRRLHNKFASKMDRQRRDPDLLAGYLTMFGLGLGLQIEPLLQRFNVRHLIVADQTPAFLALSMQAIEWSDVIGIVKGRGGRVQFLFDDKPMALSNKVYEAMRGPDRCLLDGSYVFGHYRTPVLEAALAQFMESTRVIADSDGFFEDECLMLKNASDNLSARAHRILVPGTATQPCPPAVIIGSGPSIDGEIETLKRLRDKCLFISGGTGLGVLLESGIRPDFHCEIENVAAIITVNQMVADRYGTDGIHLIAASTVDPEVVGALRTGDPGHAGKPVANAPVRTRGTCVAHGRADRHAPGLPHRDGLGRAGNLFVRRRPRDDRARTPSFRRVDLRIERRPVLAKRRRDGKTHHTGRGQLPGDSLYQP